MSRPGLREKIGGIYMLWKQQRTKPASSVQLLENFSGTDVARKEGREGIVDKIGKHMQIEI